MGLGESIGEAFVRLGEPSEGSEGRTLNAERHLTFNQVGGHRRR